jgi:CBS domain-containing protein
MSIAGAPPSCEGSARGPDLVDPRPPFGQWNQPTPAAELIDVNAMIRDAARTMRDRNLGALPVGNNGRLIGIVTDRDIVMRAVAADRGGGTTAVREVMSEGIFTCHQDDPVEDAARLMAEHKLRRVPVIDRDEQLVGIISLADLAQSGSEGGGIAADALRSVTEPTPHAPRT